MLSICMGKMKFSTIIPAEISAADHLTFFPLWINSIPKMILGSSTGSMIELCGFGHIKNAAYKTAEAAARLTGCDRAHFLKSGKKG